MSGAGLLASLSYSECVGGKQVDQVFGFVDCELAALGFQKRAFGALCPLVLYPEFRGFVLENAIYPCEILD